LRTPRAGDAIKINKGENIIVRKIRTEWTQGPKTENGAYGIYPVQTKNVLIEDSVAIGASDAGIYVGQSQNVVVRRNRAEFNVAGIEIENCIDADVYENLATNNTGGILVFNMPQLQQAGYRTRVYNNRAIANNTRNFGHAGTPVASVPAGTGVIINSNDQVEIFDNEIADNKTANIIISALFSAGYSDSAMSADFDPYPEAILIKDNHVAVCGGAGEAVRRARAFAPHLMKVEVEVDGLDQLERRRQCAGRHGFPGPAHRQIRPHRPLPRHPVGRLCQS